MKFTEEKAREVIKKFNLAESTLAVWKTRDNIPDKYFKEGVGVSEKVSGKINDKVVKILASGKINIDAFASKCGVSNSKIKDVIREKSNFYEWEYVKIRIALNHIRVDAKKHVETYAKKGRFTDREQDAFKKFLQGTPELVIMKVFEQHKLIDWRNGKPVAMRDEDYRNAINRLSVFILETSLPEKT